MFSSDRVVDCALPALMSDPFFSKAWWLMAIEKMEAAVKSWHISSDPKLSKASMNKVLFQFTQDQRDIRNLHRIYGIEMHRSRMTPSYTSYKVFKLGCIRATEGMGFNHNSSLRFHRILTPCRLNYPYHKSISVEFCRSFQMCFSMLFIFWTFIKHDLGYSKYHNLSYSTSLSSEVESRSFWLRTLVVAYKHHKMPDVDLFWHILLHRLSNINMLYNVIWYVICYNMIFTLML